MTQVGENRRHRPARLLALPLLSAIFALALTTGDAAAKEQNATIVKSVSGASIEIIRGTPSSFAVQPAGDAGAATSRYRFSQAASGWMIDHERDRLVNCFRSNTPNYREWTIHCVSRSLPR